MCPPLVPPVQNGCPSFSLRSQDAVPSGLHAIAKALFAGAVLLAHHDIEALAPRGVQLAVARVAVAVTVVAFVFLPKERHRDALLFLFLVDPAKVDRVRSPEALWVRP